MVESKSIKTLEACSGKVISKVWLDEDVNALKFEFKDGCVLSLFDAGDRYGSARYMRTDDVLSEYVGSTFLEVEIKGGPDLPDPLEEVHQILFLDIKTSKGTFQMCSHNAFTGYYGGFDLVAVPTLDITDSLKENYNDYEEPLEVQVANEEEELDRVYRKDSFKSCISKEAWAGHIGNRVSYLGEIWTLDGVSGKLGITWLDISHPKHGSMSTQATADCKPIVWNVEKMNAAEMAELSKTFLFKNVTVTDIKYIAHRAVWRMVKITWHIFNGGNGKTDAGPDQLRWLDNHGYFTGQFPEGSYMVEEVDGE